MASNDFLALPGVIQALGGPDKLQRRLGSLSNLFGGAGGVGSGIAGGVRAHEVVLLAKDMRDFLKGLRDIRRG